MLSWSACSEDLQFHEGLVLRRRASSREPLARPRERSPDRINFQGKPINSATNNPQAGPAGPDRDALRDLPNTGAVSTAAVGVKTVTGLSGFLQRGMMYRYCFCSSGNTASARSTNTTNVTNNLENIFVASPVEGTQNGACAGGILPANLGVIVNASVIPILSVIANTTGP